jgi:hypothetical protein
MKTNGPGHLESSRKDLQKVAEASTPNRGTTIRLAF